MKRKERLAEMATSYLSFQGAPPLDKQSFHHGFLIGWNQCRLEMMMKVLGDSTPINPKELERLGEEET